MSKQAIIKNTDLFKCPLCSSKMDMIGEKSLVCLKNHCFDLARSGYVNFFTRPVKTEYDQAMFHSRSIISKYGFFDSMLDTITDIIGNTIHHSSLGRTVMLDAGCGEGSHLHQVMEKLHLKTQRKFTGVGMDLSKEGIQMASKQYPDCIFCVGDLTRSPFMDEKFDVIINILSPSNYGEFKRLITKDGLLIKVIPGKEYLKELREALYHKTDKQRYSNEKVRRHFNDHFNLIVSQQVYYNKAMDEETLAHLIKMTPLSWSAAEREINKAIHAIKNITVDFTILCGKRKELQQG
ncbi:MAG TPA: methyltransferase domain-containing protein [Clostridiales bacterium]|nr:methyltransferase domain-containing protein [Clostridiales bacterium]